MKIVDIPQYKDRKALLVMAPTTSLLDAIKRMQELNCGSVMITKGAKLIGIFTERDLLVKVVANNLNIQDLKLEDVMNKKVYTANAQDNVYDSMRRMTEGRFRHLPVVDEKGDLVGMVSQGDFVAITWQQLFEQFKNKTKSSFFSMSSVWMLSIGMLVYSVFIVILFSWIVK